jgi:heme oxygenase (biliverdin-IX-beta and delta-forming)
VYDPCNHPGEAMASIMRRMRDETADLHHEAERHVRILDPDASDATYRRYLGRMLGFHAPMEDRFARHRELAAIGFDAPARRKQHLLRADLAALGPAELDPGTAARPLPVAADLPAIDDLASALGAAYVLEGSTLGGAFILSRMRARFAHLIGVATQFLDGYRGATGAMWRDFTALAERHLAGEPAAGAAVAAARATFEKLTAWLDEPAAEPPRPFRRARRPETRA